MASKTYVHAIPFTIDGAVEKKVVIKICSTLFKISGGQSDSGEAHADKWKYWILSIEVIDFWN